VDNNHLKQSLYNFFAPQVDRSTIFILLISFFFLAIINSELKNNILTTYDTKELIFMVVIMLLAIVSLFNDSFLQFSVLLLLYINGYSAYYIIIEVFRNHSWILVLLMLINAIASLQVIRFLRAVLEGRPVTGREFPSRIPLQLGTAVVGTFLSFSVILICEYYFHLMFAISLQWSIFISCSVLGSIKADSHK
jgi:hypothetical protein